MTYNTAFFPFMLLHLRNLALPGLMGLYFFIKKTSKLGERRKSGNEDLQMSFTGLGIGIGLGAPAGLGIGLGAPAGLGIGLRRARH